MVFSKEQSVVVLIHGLYMRGLVMMSLQHRFRKAGWSAEIFEYSTTRQPLDRNLEDLKRFVDGLDADYIHFVCHSLGGLIVRHFFDRYPGQKSGRVVSLGTPHRGASLARFIQTHDLGVILGTSIEKGLISPPGPWKHENGFGSLAGISRFGILPVFSDTEEENDGTVLVRETRLDGQADHIVIQAMHTQLLYSDVAFRQAEHFLVHGAFDKLLQTADDA